MAATVTQTLEPIFKDGKDKYKLTFEWVSHTDGSVSGFSTDDGLLLTTSITDILRGKELVFGEVTPGSTTPTADFDVVINDANGVDLFSGGFTDCSETATNTAFPYDGVVYGSIIVNSAITPVIAAAGDTKDGTIVLFFD